MAQYKADVWLGSKSGRQTVSVSASSLPGAVVAGYLIGAATVIMQVVLPPDARPFRDAFVYGAVIVMLIWRPNGLFSAKAAKQRV